VPDVLVRDIDPAILSRIDAAARRRGVSRNALLRELLSRYAEEQRPEPLTDAQVAAFGDAVGGLGDEQRRQGVWRR